MTKSVNNHWICNKNQGTFESIAAEDDNKETVESTVIITEPAKLLSKKLGLNRPFVPVSTDYEKEFFNKNYARFSNYDVKEADNFHTVAFGKFALFWNDCVA